MKAAGVEVPDHETQRVIAGIIAQAVEAQEQDDAIAKWRADHGNRNPVDVLRDKRTVGTIQTFEIASRRMLKLLRGDLAEMSDPSLSERLEALLGDVRREAQTSWAAGSGGKGGRTRGWRKGMIRALVALKVPAKQAPRLLSPAALRATSKK